MDFVHYQISKKVEKNNVLEPGTVSMFWWGGGREMPTLLGSLERANWNHWTTHVI
jgi:hypothetical protein